MLTFFLESYVFIFLFLNTTLSEGLLIIITQMLFYHKMPTFTLLIAARITFIFFFFNIIYYIIFGDFYFSLNTSRKFLSDEKLSISNNDVNIFDLQFQNIFVNASEMELEFNFDYERMLKYFSLNPKEFFGLLPFVSNNVSNYNSVFKKLSNWIYENKNDECCAASKCGDIVFVKTDYLKNFFERCHFKIKHPYFLMTHDSAYSVGYPWQIEYLNDPKIITWFGKNVITRHSKLRMLPLGIVPTQGYIMSTFIEYAKNVIPFNKRSTLIYLNFSPGTNKNRSSTIQLFEERYKNDSTVVIEKTRNDWKIYLSQLKSSQFIVSPAGMGPDCLRTWEALAMGAVPIVLKNEVSPLYEEMPVMIVNDWTDVTKEALQRFQLKNMTRFSKDGFPWRSKIFFRYWLNVIMSTKLNYVQTSCKK